MENNQENTIEFLLPGYFLGTLSNTEIVAVDAWKLESDENATIFNDYREVWESMGRLREMEEIDTVGALKKVSAEIQKGSSITKYIRIFQRVAAILLLPLLAYVGYLSIGNKITENKQAWLTVVAKQGMQSNIELPDGSHVWLNSGTTLQYPVNFSDKIREVKILGEGYFDVVTKKNHPFIVNTGKLNVEVLGTKFNVVNYANDSINEVVLASGKVSLFSGQYENRNEIGVLSPGQRAVFNTHKNALKISKVDTSKYLAWKDGVILFKDDELPDVAKKLERWFNVKIVIQDKAIRDFAFTAKFRDETLVQILDLLKLSSPVDYTIEANATTNNNENVTKTIYIKGTKR